MTTLSRVTLEVPETIVPEITIDPLRQELAEKARTLLGYGLLKKNLDNQVVVKIREQKQYLTLVEAFGKLNIRPFDNNEVAGYQKNEKRRSNWKGFLALPWYAKLFVILNAPYEGIDRLPLSKKSIDNIYCALFIFSFVGILVALSALVEGWWLGVTIAAPFALSGLAMIFLIGLSDKVEGIIKKEWDWNQLTFKECHERGIEIPEFALDTAVRVKELLPDASLTVEALVATDRVLGDPFLCLDYAGRKYYLEVWYESRFENRRTI